MSVFFTTLSSPKLFSFPKMRHGESCRDVFSEICHFMMWTCFRKYQISTISCEIAMLCFLEARISKMETQCPPLNRILILGQRKSDHNNRMSQLTDYVVSCLGVMGPVICDYNKRLIQLSVMLLSGVYCKT